MKLPQIDAYAFPVVIPSTKKEIKMRPYLVREEKLLLMAQESTDFKEQTDAIAQIIENCTDGVINVKQAPYFDTEFLMLQLRARSIGDVASPIYICNNEVDGNVCGNETIVKLSIHDIKVSEPSRPAANIIQINDTFELKLKFPNIYDINQMVDIMQANTEGSVLDVMPNLFDTLTNTKTKEVFDFSENTMEEKVEFLNSCPPSILEKLAEFFESMPKVEHTIKYTCSKCNWNHSIHLAGLESFLEFWGSTAR